MQTREHSLKKLKYATIQYICPECKLKTKRSIPFLFNNKTFAPFAIRSWCSHAFCEARHVIQYKIKHNQGNKPKLKIEQFTSNEEVFNKRFQVLEWYDTESKTKKRK